MSTTEYLAIIDELDAFTEPLTDEDEWRLLQIGHRIDKLESESTRWRLYYEFRSRFRVDLGDE